tara:strand:- start:830 stop:1135 length:306 start_codon:yes stop_codon:yes gene_type:complete
MSYQFATEAILALNPDLQFEIVDDDIDNITWFTDESVSRPTKDEIVAKELEIRKEQSHYLARQFEYPNMGDQLDDLYKQGLFSAEMTAKIKKVKDDNPKMT